jgi:hypothetical protein
VTGPLGSGSLGDAFINVHANTEPVEKDLEQGLDKAGRGAQPEAAKVGKDLGSTIGDGIEKEVGKQGPDIAKTLGRAIEAETLDISPDFRYNVRGSDGRFIARAAASIRDEVEEAFSSAGGGSGGFFNSLKTGLADALGAGFNISGRSPLVALLPVIIGAITGVVGALVQAANSLVAVLTTVPALLGAIGIQAGIMVLAFKGIGSAVQGAFAATNAKELAKAVEGLTPSAQKFVKSLLPIRDMIAPLQRMAQENFFRGLGNAVQKVVLFLKPFLTQATIGLAWQLGYAFAFIAQAFTSPEWGHFLQRIIPATVKWLKGFGPSFTRFLQGLIRIADASIPFLTKLGDLLNGMFEKFGTAFLNESNVAGFLDWLNSMYDTLLLVGPLLMAAFTTVASFLTSLDAAGGKELIITLTLILERLTKLLASEIGIKALTAVISIAIGSMYLLTFAVFAVIAIMAVLQATFEFISNVIIPGFINGIRDFLRWITDKWNGMIDWFKGLDDQFRIWLNGLWPAMYAAGGRIVTSLIDGMKARISALINQLSFITAIIKANKGPESVDKKLLYPAGQNIMAGLGAGIEDGAGDVMKQLRDFTTGIGGISLQNNNNPINFGANAVQVNFQGALPSEEQAMATGQAVGTGMNRMLAARNTRLAVRSL